MEYFLKIQHIIYFVSWNCFIKESLQQNNLVLQTQQCIFQLVYFKNLSPDKSKLFFSPKKQLIYQITVISWTLHLLLLHIHPNKPPTSALPNQAMTSITNSLWVSTGSCWPQPTLPEALKQLSTPHSLMVLMVSSTSFSTYRVKTAGFPSSSFRSSKRAVLHPHLPLSPLEGRANKSRQDQASTSADKVIHSLFFLPHSTPMLLASQIWVKRRKLNLPLCFLVT